MKTLAVISGIGLAIMWLIGLNNPTATTWITWLDLAAAVACFIAAGVAGTRSTAVGGPAVVSVGIFALWVIGLSTNAAAWQNWWTFAFGCVMALSAIAGTRYRRLGMGGTQGGHVTSTDRDRFRKSA